jgi:hypothetical protein
MRLLLGVVLLLDAGAPAGGAPATALERQTCEHDLRLMGEPTSEKEMAKCLSVLLRETWTRYPSDEEQYGRWLQCKVESDSPGGGKACDAILYKHLGTTPEKQAGAYEKEQRRRIRQALATLAPFRDKGLISAATFKQLETEARSTLDSALVDLFEDAHQVLADGRVKRGTELAIYVHLAVFLDPKLVPKAERAGDLVFVDAHTGKRVVRFSRLTTAALVGRIVYGEVPNALGWVAQKADARAIEVVVNTKASDRAYALLLPDQIQRVEAALEKPMGGELGQRPLLLQGDTSVSYQRWRVLAAAFRARGLDREDPDSPKLAGLVTLADLERALGSAR